MGRPSTVVSVISSPVSGHPGAQRGCIGRLSVLGDRRLVKLNEALRHLVLGAELREALHRLAGLLRQRVKRGNRSLDRLQ